MPGDRVVCIEHVVWDVGRGPKKGEVLAVYGLYLGHLEFFEYDPAVYDPIYFAPVQDATEIEATAEEVELFKIW